MTSRKHLSLVQQTAVMASVFATGMAIALPLSAQTSAPETTAPAASEVMEAPKPAAVEAPKPSIEAPAASTTPAAPQPAEALAPTAEVAPAAAPAPTTGAPATTTAAASGTIVDIAAASDTFKTLVAALTEAELTEVLQGEGPFTVFAPTDEAFAALPAGTVENLLKPENRATLIQVLTYHVVPGSITSEQIAAGEVTTVEGSPVTIALEEDKVKVGAATVVQADIMASNGVIHAIDQVIMPPSQ
ncbi:MAG: fasciclin domain-containing protein [Oculatellaceae cyanobacterium Prado106]|jgi:uncharacterized surface protein with fasciclin (FAS1) repeats|nr:fasciclin domain-containing protein [Oculatellaceae cyanobacterium Prado106]